MDKRHVSCSGISANKPLHLQLIAMLIAMQYHKSAEELYSELCHQMVALPAQDEGAEGASTHVLNALGSCFMLMCSASMQAFMSDDQSNMLYHMLPSTVAMLGSCTELIKAAPPHGHVKILLPGDIPSCTVLNCHLMLRCGVPLCAALRCVFMCHGELCSAMHTCKSS